MFKTKQKPEPRYKGCEVKDTVLKHVQDLAQSVSDVKSSAEYLNYLKFCSHFHGYSSLNIWSIFIHHPGASLVAGFRKWQKVNRFVKKGEKGIPILAPMIAHKDSADPESDRVVVGFRTVYVFDVSQTDGKEIPQIDWRGGVKNEELHNKLVMFAESLGISVKRENQASGAEGVSKKGGKEIEINEKAGVETLSHEIAHSLLHFGENRSQLTSQQQELEAESVAYVVCSHFGLDVPSCKNYLALKDIEPEQIMAHFDAINLASSKIIEAVEGKTISPFEELGEQE